MVDMNLTYCVANSINFNLYRIYNDFLYYDFSQKTITQGQTGLIFRVVRKILKSLNAKLISFALGTWKANKIDNQLSKW